MFSRRYTNFWDGLFRPTKTHILGSGDVITVNNSVIFSNATTSLTSDDSQTRAGIASDGTWTFNNNYSATEQTFDLTAGDKIYLRTELVGTSVGRIMIQRLLHSNGSYVSGTTVANSLVLSDILTVATSGLHNFKVMESTAGLMVRKSQLLINLTTAFGAGNEPSQTEFEDWIKTQSDSWFNVTAQYLSNSNQWF